MIRTSKGVTLIELLGVILIIGVFALALAPFVQKARERAYRAECANHLRHIGIALHKYALGHNGSFPDAAKMSKLVSVLTDPGKMYAEDLSIFSCPNTGHKKPSLGKEGGFAGIDYMYVSGLKATSGPSTPLCADRVVGEKLSKEDNHGRHGINVLYVNGDVKWVTVVPGGEWVKE